jgi:hypothetical protein
MMNVQTGRVLNARRAALAGVLAAIGIAATSKDVLSGVLTSVEPTIAWGPERVVRTDQAVRTTRTGPHIQNWGVFDWLHEYHPHTIQHRAPVIFKFELPGDAATLVVESREFMRSQQQFETDIAWKEVGLLFGGKAIQEKGERTYPLGNSINCKAGLAAKLHWQKALAEPVGTLLQVAKRVGSQQDKPIHQIELQVTNGKLVKASVQLESSGGPNIDLLAPGSSSAESLLKNAAVRAALAKSPNERWSARLIY